MEDRILWQKTYSGFESLSDLGRDIDEAFDSRFPDSIQGLDGHFQGDLTITISYKETP